MNSDRKSVLRSTLTATIGTMLFSVGVYLTIQANIGVAPWDVLNLGLEHRLGVQYGTASVTISLLIICIDLLLREKIGIGTVLDGIVAGKTVDLLIWLDLVPIAHSMAAGLALTLFGFFIEGLAQCLYMSVGLSCGPRDALLVALGKRLPQIPYSAINMTVLACALTSGWMLGGPVGIGTAIAPFGVGCTQHAIFKLMRFDPKSVMHQDILTSLRILLQGSLSDV